MEFIKFLSQEYNKTQEYILELAKKLKIDWYNLDDVDKIIAELRNK